MLGQQGLNSLMDLFHIETCDATEFGHRFPPIDGCIQTAGMLIWDDYRAIERITQPQQIRILDTVGNEFLQREQSLLSSKPLWACPSVRKRSRRAKICRQHVPNQ